MVQSRYLILGAWLVACGDSDVVGGSGGAPQVAGSSEGGAAEAGFAAGGASAGGAGGDGGASNSCADTGTCMEGARCSSHGNCASGVCGEGLCTEPLAFWPFNEDFASEGPAPIILMASGQAPTLEPTGNGKGAHFVEGTGGHLYVADDSFNLVQGNFTILASVTFDVGATADDVIVAKTSLNGTSDGWSFLRHSDQKLSWCYSGAGSVCLDPSGDNFFQSVSVLAGTVPYRVAVTRDATLYRLYVNDVQENQTEIDAQVVPSVQALHVGRDNSPPEIGQMAGTIDWLLFVPAALSADEIASWQPPR